MRSLLIAASAALALLLAGPVPASAQTTGAESPAATTKKPAATKRTKREPTPGQTAARERQRKCGAEWKEAKAKGATGGMKWPQFWSQCNARLKKNPV